MTELLGIPFSPWSEKARWALEVRRVPYVSRTYAPLVGEPALRWKLRRWWGKVTVPVLTDDAGQVYADSADIARWADRRGEGPELFPADHEAAIGRFIVLSEEGLAAGRALSLARVLANEDALREMVPKPLRALPAAAAVGALGVRRTLRKYGSETDRRASEAALTHVFDALRQALAAQSCSPKTLLGRFTFADIAMSQVIAFVAPPAFGLRIGRANRASFTDAALQERYADLVSWRDALYEAHRPRT